MWLVRWEPFSSLIIHGHDLGSQDSPRSNLKKTLKTTLTLISQAQKPQNTYM